MPWVDDKYSNILPQRTGSATGGANERQMLRNSSESFRTRFRLHADGSTTMLRTKDGMPEFTNTPAQEIQEETEQQLYMETGQLQWTWPGEENPTRFTQATWRLVDVGATGDWRGNANIADVTTFGEQVEPQPTPIGGVLVDSIPSVAVGYKPTNDPTIQASNEALYGSALVMKKMVCAFFPPTLFSGKMRLFMQAQYGAPLKSTGFDYTVDISGSSAVLTYAPTLFPELPSMRIGFWSHLTTGMYSAEDYRYYIVEIQQARGLSLVQVLVTPLTPSSEGSVARELLLDSPSLTDADKRKAEAYILSTLRIETDKRTLVGEYDPGYCGDGTPGGTLAYGWKFNRDGTEASIVRIDAVGDEFINTIDGRSKDITITISRNSVFDGEESGKWTIGGTHSAVHNWLDGWGSFNIFAPETETSSTLLLYSLAATRDTVARYNFSSVPVYGFYDKDDVWTTVKLSYTYNPTDKYEQEQSGLVLRTTFSLPSDWADTGDTDYDYGSIANSSLVSNSGATWEKRYIEAVNHINMDISVGSWIFNGERKNGALFLVEWSSLAGVTNSYMDLNRVAPADGSGGMPLPPLAGHVAMADYIDDAGGYFGIFLQGSLDAYHWNDRWNGTRTVVETSGDFEYLDRWALVIPSGDCNAVHVATQNSRTISPTHVRTLSWSTTSHMVSSVKRMVTPGFAEPWYWVDFSLPVFYSPLYPNTGTWTDLDNDEMVTSGDPEISAWSLSLAGEPGTPSGSYSTLFNADINFPQYGGVMAFSESDGNRYYGTEGYDSENLQPSGLFVGWF